VASACFDVLSVSSSSFESKELSYERRQEVVQVRSSLATHCPQSTVRYIKLSVSTPVLGRKKNSFRWVSLCLCASSCREGKANRLLGHKAKKVQDVPGVNVHGHISFAGDILEHISR
jgi:hypothetical protein